MVIRDISCNQAENDKSYSTHKHIWRKKTYITNDELQDKKFYL